MFWHSVEHWYAHGTGSYNCPPSGNGNGCINGTPHNYPFFSGSGSDWGEITLVGLALTAMAAWYHKHNCHTDTCWRIGRHPMAGGTFVVCRRHHNEIEGVHPARKHTVEHIRARHQAYLARTQPPVAQ